MPPCRKLSKLEFEIRKILKAGLEVGFRRQAVIPDSPRGRVPQPKAQPDVPSTQQLRRPPGLPEPDAVAPLQPAVTQLGAGVSSGTGTVAVTQGETDNLGGRDAGAGSLQAGQ